MGADAYETTGRAQVNKLLLSEGKQGSNETTSIAVNAPIQIGDTLVFVFPRVCKSQKEKTNNVLTTLEFV